MTSPDSVSPVGLPLADDPEVRLRIEEGLEMVRLMALSFAREKNSGTQKGVARRELPNAPLVAVDELVSCGRAALVEAARRYDPASGVKFKSYARARVEGAMRDAMREMLGLPPRRLYEKLTAASFGSGDEHAQANRERLLARHFAGVAAAQDAGVLAKYGVDTAQDPLAVSPRSTAEDRSHRHQIGEQLERCVATLPEVEATLIRRVYVGGEEIAEAAREIGVSKSWAVRLHGQALARLKKRLKLK